MTCEPFDDFVSAEDESERIESSEIFSISSKSSSTVLLFRSLRLNRPWNMPGFLSFRLLSSFALSVGDTILSKVSRLVRVFN